MKIRKNNSYAPTDHAFLLTLSELARPPKNLYVMGDLPKTRLPSVAIVGTRKPSAYGKEVTYNLAHALASKGVVIISGLAYGIDAIAHQAALDANGTTIAVLANGLHKVYPSRHEKLAQDIVKGGGALITEYDTGEEAMRHHFLARNRIVSGLADVVIVTEAADQSGTLSTVGHAIDQNKEVCAIPGPITSQLSVGPNRLLQQGAHVVLSADDILRLIAPSLETTQQLLPFGNTPLENRIITLIYEGARDTDELLKACEVPSSEFLQSLTMLELAGTIRHIGGQQWALSTPVGPATPDHRKPLQI